MENDRVKVSNTQKNFLTKHWTNYFCMFALIAMNLIKLYIDIPPSVMTVISTALLVYNGCLFSTKACKYGIKKEESEEHKIETMKAKDAYLFPVIGSCVLFGLFIIFKYLNKDYMNILFHIYFTFVGTWSISSVLTEQVREKPLFKKFYDNILFIIPKVRFIIDTPIKVTSLDIYTFIISLSIGIPYFITKHWILNNIIGMAFCIFGIENLFLGQYKIGLILLTLLFFYDIFWVFYTPVMVSVATNLKGPIKLMFPKHFNPEVVKDYNMIGLGDIVVPGVYVALMLRFDIYRFCILHKKEMKDLTFGNLKYFLITFIFYCGGIALTLIVMIVFNHAQPALLYLVPCTLISSSIVGIFSGEIGALWKFNEEKLDEEQNEREDREKRD